MTRGGLHWPSSTSRPETCWPKRGRNSRKGARGQPESTPVDLVLSSVRTISPRPISAGMIAGAELAESASADHHNEPTEADRTGIFVSIVPVHTAVAGRARLQIAGLRGAPELAKLIELGLTGFGGVDDVSASALTGNVTVCYAGATSLDQIISRIAALLRGEIVPAGDEAEPLLQHWHTADGADIASRLGTSSSQGLSPEEASRRLIRGGA